MDYINLLIQVNEIIHQKVQQYKEALLGNSSYADISVNQLYYLEAIHHLGTPTVSELAEHLTVSKASVSTAMQKLLHRGLIKKVHSDTDRRIYYLGLSEGGSKLISAEEQALSELMEQIKGSLSEDELNTVYRVLQSIITRFR